MFLEKFINEMLEIYDALNQFRQSYYDFNDERFLRQRELLLNKQYIRPVGVTVSTRPMDDPKFDNSTVTINYFAYTEKGMAAEKKAGYLRKLRIL